MRSLFMCCFWCCCSALVSVESEAAFWAWFQAHNDALQTIKKGNEEIASDLVKQLTAYQEDLTFEVSMQQNGIREIVISANGIRSAIPAVKKLCAAAPNMEQWKVIAFRQAKTDLSENSLIYKKIKFKPSNIYFKTFIKDGHFDIALYYPNYAKDKNDTFIGAGFLLLDMAIGELAVMTQVRYIEHNALPADLEGIEDKGFYPLPELHRHLAEFIVSKSARKNKTARLLNAASMQLYNAEKPIFRRYQPGSGIKEDKNLVVVISKNKTSLFSEQLQTVIVNLRNQKHKIIYVYKDENDNYVQYKP